MIGNARVREVMCRPVRKLTLGARVRDAAEFLRRHGISGAPVMDAHGRPVGVFSLMDLAGHLNNRLLNMPEVDPRAERVRETGESVAADMGFHFEGFDDSRVSDLMTPQVICVDPDAPIEAAVRTMAERSIHRVFVRKGDGPLVGVITTMDILRWVGGMLKAPRQDGKRRRVG